MNERQVKVGDAVEFYDSIAKEYKQGVVYDFHEDHIIIKDSNRKLYLEKRFNPIGEHKDLLDDLRKDKQQDIVKVMHSITKVELDKCGELNVWFYDGANPSVKEEFYKSSFTYRLFELMEAELKNP